MVNGVGQGVPECEIGSGVVTHGQHAVLGSLELRHGVGGDETIHLPPVPRHVLGRPLVREVERALGIGRDGVQVKRQQVRRRPSRPCLSEDTGRPRRVVVKATHALVRAEIVVEGPVLVHQEDDVLDRTEVRPCRGHGGGFAGGLSSARRQGHGEGAGHARHQHFARASVSSTER